MHQFVLEPSVGLSEIKLGMSVYHLLQQLPAYQMTFVFPPDHGYYFVLLPQLDARLIVDSRHQLVLVIELMDMTRLGLVYQGHTLKDFKFQTVYDHYFGPTYPGSYDAGRYTLNYPGISFRFDVDLGESHEQEESTELLKRVMELNPKVHSLAIHQFTRWSEMQNTGFHIGAVKRLAQDEVEIDTVTVEVSPKKKIELQLNFFKHPQLKQFVLVIDKSLQQDILAELGPPDEVFMKNDSRSMIHGQRNSSTGGSDKSTHIFHNYFRYGFDLLYTMTRSGSVLTKVVLHCNIPNSVLFGKYRKCVWSMNGGSIHSELTMDKLDNRENQVVINRNEMLGQSVELIDGTQERNENVLKWGKSVVITSGDYVTEFANGRINALTLF